MFCGPLPRVRQRPPGCTLYLMERPLNRLRPPTFDVIRPFAVRSPILPALGEDPISSDAQLSSPPLTVGIGRPDGRRSFRRERRPETRHLTLRPSDSVVVNRDATKLSGAIPPNSHHWTNIGMYVQQALGYWRLSHICVAKAPAALLEKCLLNMHLLPRRRRLRYQNLQRIMTPSARSRE